MTYAIWALFIGALLTTMALSGTLLQRLPLSTSMLYLAAGYALGPAGWGLMSPDPFRDSLVLERVAELAVLISLFTVGLKLGLAPSVAVEVIALTLTVVVVSIVLHGISVTPLMNLYARRKTFRRRN